MIWRPHWDTQIFIPSFHEIHIIFENIIHTLLKYFIFRKLFRKCHQKFLEVVRSLTLPESSTVFITRKRELRVKISCFKHCLCCLFFYQFTVFSSCLIQEHENFSSVTQNIVIYIYSPYSSPKIILYIFKWKEGRQMKIIYSFTIHARKNKRNLLQQHFCSSECRKHNRNFRKENKKAIRFWTCIFKVWQKYLRKLRKSSH